MECGGFFLIILKLNDVVKLWKCSLKMVRGRRGGRRRGGGRGNFRAECNS